MLAIENTSNNASDGRDNLLHLGDTGQLSFNSLSSVPLPELTPEDVLWALSMELTSSESQALEYFGGYVLKKMTKIHSGECEVCCDLGAKMTVASTGIEWGCTTGNAATVAHSTKKTISRKDSVIEGQPLLLFM
jgi:hypothetical protein